MENNITNKVYSIIMTEVKKEDDEISLLKYIELIDYLNNQIASETRKFIKSINHKLSNNLAFFDYEIKSVKLTNVIIINISHELKSKEIIVSPKTLKVTSDLKNKEVFNEIINNDLKKLLNFLEQYSYLNNISTKFKSNDLNVILNSKVIELFMYKSPNWITMGKAFSLKYLIEEKKFKYEVDSVNLETNIKNQEKLLFSKIYFKLNLLPTEMQTLKIDYKKDDAKKKNNNLIRTIIDKLLRVVKK